MRGERGGSGRGVEAHWVFLRDRMRRNGAGCFPVSFVFLVLAGCS